MIQWICRYFGELTPHELYEILRLRNEVFVVEQQCVYADTDGKDLQCYHYMGWLDGRLAAYTRLIPAGISYKEISIGRVVSAPEVRRSGMGRELMTGSILKAYELFGNQDIVIGAQLYLKTFYSSLGFEQEDDVYLEDGIEHITMRLSTKHYM